jgi:ammonia channel protein AmtB
VHAIGGTLGAFLTGVLATTSVNPTLSLSAAPPLNSATRNGLAKIIGHMLGREQLKAIVITICACGYWNGMIVAIVRGGIGLQLRPRSSGKGSTSTSAAKRAMSRHEHVDRRRIAQRMSQNAEHFTLLANLPSRGRYTSSFLSEQFSASS